MTHAALVERALAAILEEDLEPLLALSADRAVLTVTGPGAGGTDIRVGRDALAGYFRELGALVTCWQLRILDAGDEVLVLGRERFRLAGGIEGASDFTLRFDLRDGLIAGLHVLEGLPPEAPSLHTGGSACPPSRWWAGPRSATRTGDRGSRSSSATAGR